jgi:hypothetical protein
LNIENKRTEILQLLFKGKIKFLSEIKIKTGFQKFGIP